MPPDHSRQAGVLFAEGPVQIAPTPFRHGREGALVTVFRRYLAHDGLALQDVPQTWVKPRKSKVVPFAAGCCPCGRLNRKSTKRVLVGWR